MELFERFGQQYELLQESLDQYQRGQEFPCERLNQIFVFTEKKWEENLDRLKDVEVKYLLIAEAPPWAPNNNKIKYFYSTAPSPWRTRVWNTFCDTRRPDDPEEVLQTLAEKKFLLIDTLPFPVKYTSNMRRDPRYIDLIKQCSSFFCDKLKHPRITWSREIKIAFALKLNGLAVMDAYSGNKCLSFIMDELNEDNIAADGSGNPNKTKMREIFGLINLKALMVSFKK